MARIAWTRAKIDLRLATPEAMKSMAEEHTAMRCALEKLELYKQDTVDRMYESAREKLKGRST